MSDVFGEKKNRGDSKNLQFKNWITKKVGEGQYHGNDHLTYCNNAELQAQHINLGTQKC